MSEWDDIDYPVLNAIFEIERERNTLTGVTVITAMDVRRSTGLDRGAIQRSMKRLAEGNMIGNRPTASLSEAVEATRVLPNGMRALGEWPSQDRLAEILPALLEQLADRTTDKEESGLLRRAADVLQQVTAATLSAVIRDVIGLR